MEQNIRVRLTGEQNFEAREMRMKTRLSGAVLVLLTLLAGVVFGQESRTARKAIPVPLDGAAIFRDYCAVCHGPDGKGKGPATEALRHSPPDITLLSSHNHGKFPADRIKAVLVGQQQSGSAHGTREMPIWGPIFHVVERDQDFGEVRLDNVTKFVESLQAR